MKPRKFTVIVSEKMPPAVDVGIKICNRWLEADELVRV
jgi:hypothetical protein